MPDYFRLSRVRPCGCNCALPSLVLHPKKSLILRGAGAHLSRYVFVAVLVGCLNVFLLTGFYVFVLCISFSIEFCHCRFFSDDICVSCPA